MLRQDEDIAHADRVLRDFMYYLRRREWLEEKLYELEVQLSTFGVSSPGIMSLEEAKYQRGTRIYSDTNLLEIFAKQDDLEREIQECSTHISRVCKRLAELDLNDHQIRLLYYRYEKNLTYELIADRMNYSRQAIQWQMDYILKRFGTR